MSAQSLPSSWMQLAENLAWLEKHCRDQESTAGDSHLLRLAGSLVRNVMGPVLLHQSEHPKQIAVIGGAGAGKSTVTNFLIGAVAAEANPQAGFTRHPVAYIGGLSSEPWPNTPGFLGPLRLLSQPAPSSLDDDVYQIRRVHGDARSLLREAVIWDCPDMTTWAATSYVPRLIEICGLADLLVYVASDERYNDEIPTRFLNLLLETGKTVVVVLTKMRDSDRTLIIEHFQREVVGKGSHRPAAILAIPQLTADQLADPAGKAAEFRLPLVETVRQLSRQPSEARPLVAARAVDFLLSYQEKLLAVAQVDLAALERWNAVVREGQKSFDRRYQREYLDVERFPRFDEAMVRLIDLLEFPGLGQVVSGALYVIRTPYRVLKGLVQKSLAQHSSSSVPERRVMETALQDWLSHLGVEAKRRAGTHPIWDEAGRSFDAQLQARAREVFEKHFQEFQLAVAADVENTSRAIYADLESDSTKLNILRGSKLAFDLLAVTGAVVVGGLNLWDIALVPLAASVSQLIAETLGWQYLEGHREAIRQRQGRLARELVADRLTVWLCEWPLENQTSYAQMRRVLREIPTQLQELSTVLRTAAA